LLNIHGVDSAEAARFLAAHGESIEFVRLAKVARAFKRETDELMLSRWLGRKRPSGPGGQTVDYLHDRYIGDDPKRRAALGWERLKTWLMTPIWWVIYPKPKQETDAVTAGEVAKEEMDERRSRRHAGELTHQWKAQRAADYYAKMKAHENDMLLGTLGPGALRVKSPIAVTVSLNAPRFVLEATEIDEYGEGDDLYDAIRDLQATIVELYGELKKNQKDLGPDLERVWAVLQSKVAEAE
jgi:hypothetical protein